MRRDLSGMNLAGLVRMSWEIDPKKNPDTDSSETAADSTRRGPMTGRDIINRDEQVKDCHQLVEAMGGTYIHTYDEPDTSAWKRQRVITPDGRVIYRVIRPVYEGALDDLRQRRDPNGQRLDGLIVYDIDRLIRDNRDLEDAIDVVTRFGRPIIDYSGTLDLLTDNGRTVARIVVATKAQQSADTARRVKRKHEAIQQAGIPVGGSRPFGWLDDKRTLHPIESVELQKAIARFLDPEKGATLGEIVSDWNERGILTANGKRWQRRSLISVLRNPRLCGYRMRQVHNFDQETGSDNKQVEICYDAEGNPVIGQWKRIITPEEREALIELLGAGPKRGDGYNARKYLLTGTIRCGKPGCGKPMRAVKATPAQGKPEGFFWYACKGKNDGGCGGTRVDGPAADAWAKKLVITRYEEDAAKRQATHLPTEWDKQAELDQVRADIADLNANKSSISSARYWSMLAQYDATETQLTRERNKHLRKTAVHTSEPVNLRADWDTDRLPFLARRRHVENTLEVLVCAPAKGRRGVKASDRLTPVWRDPDPED